MDENKLTGIASLFMTSGRPCSARRLGNGLINDTFIIACQPGGHSYVLQRINTDIFRDPDTLQDNMLAISAHLRKCLIEEGIADADRRALECVLTHDSKSYVISDGECWRMTRFIEGSVSIAGMSEKMARNVGLAFGKFHCTLVRPDAPELGETIPDFHNMPLRLSQLEEAMKADRVGRLADVREMADELLARTTEMMLAENMHSDGRLPKRIIHCDTKADNILFDENGEILCVIDLDTTMPGFVMDDFGDFLRTAGNTAAEDEPDTSKIRFDMDVFRPFARGYVESASFLTPEEKMTLVHGALRMTYMQAIRFFADYLNGDTYYKTAYTDHNLVRTRNQMTLLSSIDSHMEEMKAFIDTLYRLK